MSGGCTAGNTGALATARAVEFGKCPACGDGATHEVPLFRCGNRLLCAPCAIAPTETAPALAANPQTRCMRVVRVRLECGCAADLHTSRYRVTREVAASVYGHATRAGVWCDKHGGLCQPTGMIGVMREDAENATR